VLLCTLIVGQLAGYALARLEFRGKGMVFNAMLLILIVPFQLWMIPLYVMIVRGYPLGDTYLGMILPFAVNATAVFIFRQFFLQLPGELFESARLDGASELKILTRVAIPLARPAILTAVQVERLGLALEPEELWERHRGGGGVENPRITSVPTLGRWVMTCTAWGPLGPRIALACSDDLERWERLGPVGFALPEQPWEAAKLGGGAPPLRRPEGWLVLHHGVAGRVAPGRVDHQPAVRYSAGALLLDPDDVTRVLARSASPLLEPELPAEREGVVPDVVFPTAIDPLGDAEADVYYGMADARIGAFRLAMGPLPRR
jgi:predicted GH43/DUF377 family glycosyl hydrolase